MRVKDDIKVNAQVFKDLCESHHVHTLYAFGSSTSEKFDPQRSDIDLLVEIDSTDPIEKGELLMDLWDRFEQFFKRKVDLLTESSIQNPYLKNSVQSSKVLLYDGNSKKVFV